MLDKTGLSDKILKYNINNDGKENESTKEELKLFTTVENLIVTYKTAKSLLIKPDSASEELEIVEYWWPGMFIYTYLR